MSAGLFLAAAALAQAADAPAAPAYGPAAAPPPPKAAASSGTAKDCSPSEPDPETGAIVVCVVKPNGYRIDPDILAAKKAKKKADTWGPRPPERYTYQGGPVGPQYGCMGTQCVNLLAVAMTAAQIADRLSKGQEIASVFKTQPSGSSEYQLYQQARQEREMKQAEKAAKAYAARVEAEAKAAEPDKAEAKPDK